MIILFGQFLPYSRLRIPVAWFSQRRCLLLGEVRRKIYRLETYYGKGGGAPVPDLATGVFPLRPERPRKIKCIRSEKGEIFLDTDRDAWIYLAPRSGDIDGAFVRGKDLYIHEQEGLPDIYYIHSWSMIPDEAEVIQPVSLVSAEEFLEIRGLMLSAYPEQKGSLALRSYGYGIAEEF